MGSYGNIRISLYLFVYYKALNIEILFISCLRSAPALLDKIMTNIYYSSEILFVDGDLQQKYI